MKSGKCHWCNEHSDKLTFEKIKSKRGDFCDDCLGGYEQHCDNEREEKKIEGEG